MKTKLVVTVGLLVGALGVSTNGVAQAEPIEAYTLIGEDPQGDFEYKLAEQGDPSGLFGTGKIDIIRLDAGLDGDTLNLRMTLPGTTGYGGLGNHMWTVEFDVDGTSYDACWTVITAGTSAMSNDVQENTRGCSMFGAEDVGPRTKADGLRVVQEEETWYIEWPFPVDDVGGLGVTMENIVAKTWARTGDTDDSPPEYQFDLHDVAPDGGAWTYVVGAAGADAADYGLEIVADMDSVTAAPGQAAEFGLNVTLVGAGQANVTLSVEGVPENWTASFDGTSLVGVSNGTNTSAALSVSVPSSSEHGTYGFVVNATSEDNVTALLNLTVVVDASLAAGGSGGSSDGQGGGNATDEGGAALDADDEAAIPGPGLFVTALVGAVSLWLSRRRDETL